MKPAGYRDLQAADIPEVSLTGGGRVRVIAGSYAGTTGAITGTATDANYFDVHLPAGAAFTHPVKDGYIDDRSVAVDGGDLARHRIENRGLQRTGRNGLHRCNPLK